MKLVRFKNNGEIGYGILEGNNIVEVKSFYDLTLINEQHIDINSVEILVPVEPKKILCVGLNYKTHADEVDKSVSFEPVIFMKPSTSLIKSGENIIHPSKSKRVDYEGELGVVIGKKGKNITASEAKSYILGYFCANDVTARDLQPLDGQWIIAKGFDTFLPVGEHIETNLDLSKAKITTKLNGEIKQQAPISDMIFSVEEIIAYCSSVMTLEAGDIILTGTPSGIGKMVPNDKVCIEIDGIGQCCNTVVGE